MIDIPNSVYELHCDTCAERLPTTTDDFMDAIEEVKAFVWIVKINDESEFEHFCCEECCDKMKS